jgi:hypothetical protein
MLQSEGSYDRCGNEKRHTSAAGEDQKPAKRTPHRNSAAPVAPRQSHSLLLGTAPPNRSSPAFVTRQRDFANPSLGIAVRLPEIFAILNWSTSDNQPSIGRAMASGFCAFLVEMSHLFTLDRFLEPQLTPQKPACHPYSEDPATGQYHQNQDFDAGWARNRAMRHPTSDGKHDYYE